MGKNKNIISVHDSDINFDALEKAIQNNPDLSILKHLGEIRIDIEDSYSLGKEDNRFDAYNGNGSLSTYGDINDSIKDLKIVWSPNVDDVKHAIDGNFDNEIRNGKEIKADKIDLENRKSTLFVKNVIQARKEFDITDILKSEKIQSIEEYILENLVG